MDFNKAQFYTEIFGDKVKEHFDELALQAFAHQYYNNRVYNEYCKLLGTDPAKVDRIEKIPFLPVEFFKTHKIICRDSQPEIEFTSSGTTGSTPSTHFVSDVKIYEQAFLRGFEQFYGKPENYCIMGLLPAYLERSGSSLVYMVDALIKLSGNKKSGFFLHEHEALYQNICQLEAEKAKYLLIGVSFGLLDFTDNYQPQINHGIIMETGGMKGRRKEMVRDELHDTLKQAFGVGEIHSEYGMTELLSQAYSQGNGIYKCSDTMKVLVRETNDPLTVSAEGSGAINIIDLANINSCSFLQTADLGKVNADGSFTVAGRFDNADVRGCNLMVI